MLAWNKIWTHKQSSSLQTVPASSNFIFISSWCFHPDVSKKANGIFLPLIRSLSKKLWPFQPLLWPGSGRLYSFIHYWNRWERDYRAKGEFSVPKGPV